MTALQYYFNRIQDEKIKNLFISFREHMITTSTLKDDGIKKTLMYLRRVLENIKFSDLSWELLCDVANDKSASMYLRGTTVRLLLNFLLFLDESGEYYGSYKGEFASNGESIRALLKYNRIGFITELDSKKTSPKSIIVWRKRGVTIASVIQSKNVFLLELFQRFLDESSAVDRHKVCNAIRFFSYFENAIYPSQVKCFEDLNDNIFFELVRKVSVDIQDVKVDVGSRVVVFFQWLMTIITPELRESNFPLVNTPLLTYIYVVKNIVDGTEIVKYSPYEKPKYYNKMLLIPSSDDSHLNGDSYRVYPLDVTEIGNTKLKKWYIDFFWKTTSIKLSNRKDTLSSIFKFLQKLDEKITIEETEIKISEADIAEYVSYYKNTNVSESKISFRLQQLKKFLQFIESEYSYPVKEIFYRMMVFSNGKSKPNKNPYSSEDIKRIIEHLRFNKPLIACAILIISNSELRTSSVMNLKVDCLVKNVSKKGLEEYSVKVHTKTSSNEIELVNINQYVKVFIDEALKLTEKIRKYATSYEKDYVFIFQPSGRSMPRRFKPEAFSNAIRRTCSELNIEFLGTKGLRNNYMQGTSNLLSKKNLSHKLTKSLTGHSGDIHHRNYDQLNISEFFEQYYNLSIGNVYLRGTIKSKTTLSKNASVVENCGFCSEEHCQLDGKVDCFMCKSFVTTLSCIPFYEKEIEKIEHRIMKQTISHEKDFLLSKKKLLVGYLVKLYELKEESKHGN